MSINGSRIDLDDVPVQLDGGGFKTKKGAYEVQNGGKKIRLTVYDVTDDYIDSDAILDYLAQQQVIKDPKAWRCKKIEDTSSPFDDDLLSATLTLVRLPHAPL